MVLRTIFYLSLFLSGHLSYAVDWFDYSFIGSCISSDMSQPGTNTQYSMKFQFFSPLLRPEKSIEGIVIISFQLKENGKLLREELNAEKVIFLLDKQSSNITINQFGPDNESLLLVKEQNFETLGPNGTHLKCSIH